MPEIKTTRFALAEKLRRCAARAEAMGNPYTKAPFLPSPVWTASTAVVPGQVVRNSNGEFVYISGGTTAASGTGPSVTGAATGEADGSAFCTYLGGPDITVAGADAPTFTTASTAPADFTNRDKRETQPSVIKARGGVPSLYGGNKWQISPYDIAPGTPEYGKGSFVEFYTDALRICFEQSATFPGYRFTVDGRYVQKGGTPVSASAQYHTLDFSSVGGRRVRRITVEASRVGIQSSIFVPQKSQIWWTPQADEVRAAFISDSEMSGSSYGPALHGATMPNIVARTLGWSDPWNFSKDGTGWINKGAGSAFYTFRERLPQVLAANPDVMVAFGSPNDFGVSDKATITAEVTAFLQAARAGSYSGPIVIFGVMPLNNAQASATEVAIAAGVAAFSDPLARTFFIPILNDPLLPWISQSWNNANNTFSQNGAYYIAGDNLHLPDIGTLYMGQRMAQAIAGAVLPNL